jgi:hypothetical protein
MPRRAGSPSYFDVHGLWFRVDGDWPEVQESIRLDFAWFERDGGPSQTGVEITVERRPPQLEAFGELPAAFVTPRNTVYQDGARTIVEYFGRAVSVFDRRSSRMLVQGDEEGLVHEAAYHFMLSTTGIHLDRLGLVRLHGLGLSGPRGGVVVTLPSGGGKTTLALQALRDDGVRLLSEDTPLIDRRGVLHPFVLRMGVNEADAAKLGLRRPRRLERMESLPKLAVEVETFADRVEREPRPLRELVIGRRTLGDGASLERIPRWGAVGPLLREAVVGVGVYQGMEFVLQHGMRDVLGKVGIGATRAVCCTAALARARVWSLTLGRDGERNWNALRPLLIQDLGDRTRSRRLAERT